jgi:transcriptional accessory protein Tex/SPT6
MNHEWTSEIRDCFPDWQTDNATARWPETKAQLSIGQKVSGEVIARAPFGVWVNIGVGHPALLLVPEMEGADKHPIKFEEYPPLGAIVTAWIVGLGDKAEIGLSQFPGGRHAMNS